MNKRLSRALLVVAAGAALAGCASGGGQHRPVAGGVVLIQRGSRATNAYALAYQTCNTTSLQKIVADVKASSTDPTVVGRALARHVFSPPFRAAAAQGCTDALEGKAPNPPAAKAGSGKTS